MIDTKIQLKVKGSNGEQIIELPIIGYVSPDRNPLKYNEKEIRKYIEF